MHRSLLSRIIIVVVALTAGFASPTSALAHGWAHHHEHDTGGHAIVRAGLEDVHADHDTLSFELLNAEAGDHPHQAVDDALTAKGVQLLAVIALHIVVPSTALVAVVAPPRVDVSRERLPRLAHAPPPRLRAPPTPLG